MNKDCDLNVIFLCISFFISLSSFADTFEATANSAISGYNNRNLVNVSVLDCKRFCIEESQFYCKSFDYNKIERWCDLSAKSKEDVGGLTTNYPGNPYDHYSRNDDYKISPNAAISGYNHKHLLNVTPDDCKRACDTEKSFDCVSFDYYKYVQKCDLSSATAIEVGGLKRDYPDNPYDHYAKSTLFTKFKKGKIVGNTLKTLSNVSADECRKACKSTTTSYCLSFDYHTTHNSCELYSVQADTVGGLATDYNSSQYDHYSSDTYYKLTSNAAISGYNNKHLSNVSIHECITACEAEIGFTCKSFDYCKIEKACDLSDKNASEVSGLKRDYTNNPFDHYSRPSSTYENRISISRKSRLSIEDRQALIRNNLPVWIIALGEEFFPKPFQEYLQYDVKSGTAPQGPFTDLIAWDDLRHHYYNGSHNTTPVRQHLLGVDYRVSYLSLPSYCESSSCQNKMIIDPRAAPTYAFYSETNTNEIWIRYFLFFGFNKGSAVAIGNHFADWVHTSVKLKNQNGRWTPVQYYFSQHAGGETLSSTSDKLAFFAPDGPNKIKEVTFEEAKLSGNYHVRAFAARGNHEVHPVENHGYIVAGDYTNYGFYFVLPNTWEWFPSNPTRSNMAYLPYYAWDMTDAKFQPRPTGWPYSSVEYAEKLPLALFGTNDDFSQLWFYKNSAIRDSGQKTSIFEKGFSATAPPLKILEWGNNFEK
jgi:hypothetical protein